MPAFEQTLTDDAIEAVIDHIEIDPGDRRPRFGQIGGDPQPADDGDGGRGD
jgi:hypothetical protein